MRYSDVCIEALSYVLPPRVVTSAAVERWLKPVYERLHLPEGRLELMSGIRERRLWEDGTRPSEVSAQAGASALRQAELSCEQIDCLIHCSVSRDFVEPATSTAVHRLLKLPSKALNFDVSNACLGMLSGMIIMANMIQLGQVQAGLLVAGENSGPLLQNTINDLNGDVNLTRRTIKPHFASLTIGSAAAAAVLTHKSISRTGHRLVGGAHAANTVYNHLCQGSADTGMTGESSPRMFTDAEQLLEHGVEIAAVTWEQTKADLGWTNNTPALICCHQVGRAHRQQLYQRLQLDLGKDFSTFEFLGNCGSASLPVTAAMAFEQRNLQKGDQIALLGIGSGINCTMLGLQW